jgi:putative GTP pyrophosphokinase
MSFYDEIASSWEEEKPIFEEIGAKTSLFLKNEILNHEIYPEITYRTKELLSIVKKIQRKSKEKAYHFNDLKDKLGVRIVCSFSSDLDIVDKIIRQNFHIEKAEYKKEELEFDKLDYTSNHYDLKINSKKIIFENFEEIKNKTIELQVRSINQHAWSSSAHILTYKKEAEIPKNLQRRVYRLLSLYEIADDEFSNINYELKEKENGLVYNYIRKLEGKIFKYAKVDFDRQMSISTLKHLFSPFNIEKQKSLTENVLLFVTENDKKIENIFKNYSNKFFRNPILTQPEIFLIFYMMDYHISTLEDIYTNELDYEELEKIKGIWV